MIASVHWALWLGTGAAIATSAILLGSAIFALWQIRESVTTRSAELFNGFARQWDEPLLRNSRVAMSQQTPKGIEDLVRNVFEQQTTPTEDEAFYNLQALPNFLETIGVFVEETGLSIKLIDRLWGSGILVAWDRWEPAVQVLRQETQQRGRIYQHFERLAQRIEKLRADERARELASRSRY